MKTAMQELLEILEQDQYCGSKSKFAKSFLEKEKQQIVNARIDGVQKSLSIPKTFAFKKSEEYYYSTFGEKV